MIMSESRVTLGSAGQTRADLTRIGNYPRAVDDFRVATVAGSIWRASSG
jgi:hypothetical protein